MLKTIFRVFAIIFIGFVCGLIGMIVGSLIGGNYAEQFVFNSVQGYEATGQVGFILASLIGLISSWRLMFKRKSLSSLG